ncbi:MAG: hypothetical protein V2A79_10175 [Planctomycetota bacterium]
MKTKMTMVGSYNLGNEMVRLVLREGSGADLYVQPGDLHYPRFKIGADADTWGEIVTCLLHEATEFVAMKLWVRYHPSPDIAHDNGAYLFVLTHTQFGETCGRVGDFPADCLPDLKAAWKKWRKP